MLLFILYLPLISGVTIGFERILYSVEEGSRIETCAVIVSGTLERTAEVVIRSNDGTATGKIL